MGGNVDGLYTDSINFYFLNAESNEVIIFSILSGIKYAVVFPMCSISLIRQAFLGGKRTDMVQNISLFLTISVSITIALPPLEDFRGHAGSVNDCMYSSLKCYYFIISIIYYSCRSSGVGN